jgi:hypothetical protein
MDRNTSGPGITADGHAIGIAYTMGLSTKRNV